MEDGGEEAVHEDASGEEEGRGREDIGGSVDGSWSTNPLVKSVNVT
jgi:hypothetical protein